MASSPSVDGPASDGPDDDGAPVTGAPVTDDPATDPNPDAPRPVPSEEELGRIAVDVRIRRRPRYGVFIVLGMLLAGAAALVWTTSVPSETHANWGATVWVTTLGAMAFGALFGAGVGVFADWLSRRK